MDDVAYVALSRQMALQHQMTVIANNIANAGSAGFKAENLLFEEALEDAGAVGDVAFVQDVALYRNPASGPMTPTGSQFDVAIQGPGYLAVETPAGQRFSRSGALALNPEQELVTSAGHPVLDDSGSPIALPEGARDLAIAADGTVSAEGRTLGRLGVVQFGDEQALEMTGEGLYRTDQAPEPAPDTRLIQGMIEQSNVNPVLEMTAMIETVRAFQGTQQLIEIQHELERKAIEQVLAVNA